MTLQMATREIEIYLCYSWMQGGFFSVTSVYSKKTGAECWNMSFCLAQYKQNEYRREKELAVKHGLLGFFFFSERSQGLSASIGRHFFNSLQKHQTFDSSNEKNTAEMNEFHFHHSPGCCGQSCIYESTFFSRTDYGTTIFQYKYNQIEAV